jgi:hypothetical protein
MKRLPISLLRQPESGKLFWRERPVSMFAHCKNPRQAAGVWNGRYAGNEAMTADSHGYRVGRIYDRMFPAHRVIFALHYGRWPTGEIDHINHDRSDNRLKNLREVEHGENCRNMSPRQRTKSGITGVWWHPGTRKWRATIQHENRRIDLGLHACIARAISARRAAEREHAFHENHCKRIPA